MGAGGGGWSMMGLGERLVFVNLMKLYEISVCTYFLKRRQTVFFGFKFSKNGRDSKLSTTYLGGTM